MAGALCDRLLDEAKHYTASGLPQRAPNTMNNYGVVLNEVGLRPTFDAVLRDYTHALGAAFFGDAPPATVHGEWEALAAWLRRRGLSAPPKGKTPALAGGDAIVCFVHDGAFAVVSRAEAAERVAPWASLAPADALQSPQLPRATLDLRSSVWSLVAAATPATAHPVDGALVVNVPIASMSVFVILFATPYASLPFDRYCIVWFASP